MREFDKQDMPGLGEKVVKPEMPKPYIQVAPNVWRHPTTGKLHTSNHPPEPSTVQERTSP